jgi:NAD(P)-dependent dehydrogenase (short-subunit alcohol dehydrogenase family)
VTIRRVALVTGGLDRVGAAIAARLAADGWSLALHARHHHTMATVLADALRRHDAAHAVFTAELADEAAVLGLVPAVADRFGMPVTALVNSASAIAEGSWAEVGSDALIAFHRVNVVAPTLLVRALAAGLPAGGTAAVVNIVDQRVTNPPVDQAAYTASKLALAGLTRVLARAYAPALRVNAVGPGLTIPGDDYAGGQAGRLAARMPLRRLPDPSDIAQAVAFLLHAPAVTGQTLMVDGGASLESFRRDFVHMERDG